VILLLPLPLLLPLLRLPLLPLLLLLLVLMPLLPLLLLLLVLMLMMMMLPTTAQYNKSSHDTCGETQHSVSVLLSGGWRMNTHRTSPITRQLNWINYSYG
jgi:hypothetical protein